MTASAEIPGAIDLLHVHRAAPARYPFLLQSVAAHPRSGRYDILFGDVGDTLSGANFFADLQRDFAAAFDQRAARTGLPFVGGWFLLLGYEAAALTEPRLRLPASPHRLPDAVAVRCRAAMIHDRARGVTTLISECGTKGIAALRDDLARAGEPSDDPPLVIADVAEDAPERFTDGVRRIVEYLRAGDIFQANLSRAWRARLAQGDAAMLYRRLCATNPAPFAGLARIGECWVLSSSPERLASVDGRRVDTRPIAGTRPRGRDEREDRALRSALIGNLKERAEHVMLIDLERNDLGRVCVPGTVAVSELMTIESYAHVHHIVSNVCGELRAGLDPVDVLAAVFPGGTITGCPKLRAMDIIGELEGVGRGPYTGAMGYLSRCGRMDSNILIRTLVLDGRQIRFRAGAGIVADSDPAAELAETRAKARGMLMALGA